jgi:hypothetical protein
MAKNQGPVTIYYRNGNLVSNSAWMTTFELAKRLKIWPKELGLVTLEKYRWDKARGLHENIAPDMEQLIAQNEAKTWEKCFNTGFYYGDNAEYSMYATESNQIVLINRTYASIFSPHEVHIMQDYSGMFKSTFESTYIMGGNVVGKQEEELSDRLQELVRVLHRPKRL